MKRAAILAYIIPCILGSYIYTIIFTNEFNAIPSFSLSWIDMLLLFLFLFIWSSIIFLPICYIIYQNFKKYTTSAKLTRKLNLVSFIYFVFLFLVISYFTKSFIEALQLIASYLLAGFFSLNILLKIKEKIENNN